MYQNSMHKEILDRIEKDREAEQIKPAGIRKKRKFRSIKKIYLRLYRKISSTKYKINKCTIK